jgi:hypothetical protein
MLRLSSLDSFTCYTQSGVNVRCSLVILAVNLWLEESRFALSHANIFFSEYTSNCTLQDTMEHLLWKILQPCIYGTKQ